MEIILRSQNDILSVQNELMNILPELSKKPFRCEITQYRERRSLDANAYFHLLVGKIAEKLNTGNEETKRRLNLEYGAPALNDDGTLLVVKVPLGTDITRFYPYPKFYRDKKEINGKISNYYLFYKPTHELDTKEMARLIDGVVNEAKELGIDTRTPEELASMKSLWRAMPQC
ncbi:MAG: hypothetical protein NC548_51540 [Lachnospiraceae bacterium]|nr:hypothetical protein [Lachnospiraceae bacterium]